MRHNHGPDDAVYIPDSCLGCLTERLTESLRREQLLKVYVVELERKRDEAREALEGFLAFTPNRWSPEWDVLCDLARKALKK